MMRLLSFLVEVLRPTLPRPYLRLVDLAAVTNPLHSTPMVTSGVSLGTQYISYAPTS